MSNSIEKNRVLGYVVARELTPEEVCKVSGGASNNTRSYSGENSISPDDVATDEF